MSCAHASTFMYPSLCLKYREHVFLSSIASWSFFTLSSILYQSLCWCWEVLRPSCFLYPFVCLLICLGCNANMTMCALDTRNDSKRDTNASPLMSFCNSLSSLSFFSSLILYCIMYLQIIVLTGWWVRFANITTLQIVQQDGWFLKGQVTWNTKMTLMSNMQIVLILFAWVLRWWGEWNYTCGAQAMKNHISVFQQKRPHTSLFFILQCENCWQWVLLIIQSKESIVQHIGKYAYLLSTESWMRRLVSLCMYVR